MTKCLTETWFKNDLDGKGFSHEGYHLVEKNCRKNNERRVGSLC